MPESSSQRAAVQTLVASATVSQEGASAEAEEFLVEGLTAALNATLADALEVGVEGPIGLSLTDIDVPSVVAHEQNS
jgi:hypothetical protein